MSIINKGTAFSNGEQLTADKLNDLVDLATFDQSATDSASTTVNSSGQIVVADSGISTSKIANSNVTKDKIEDVADYKVLGNVSGAAAAPAEVAILDEDDMVSNSATSLATQQSIKVYVDNSALTFTPSTYAGEESVTLPNGLIMKFGTTASGVDPSVAFVDNFPNAVMSVTVTARTAYNDNLGNACFVSGVNTGGFNITNGRSVKPNDIVNWQAIGY